MGARKEKVWSEDAAADAWEADTKNPNAIRLLGVAYERGRGRAANAKMARKMFLKSAMMGDVTAMRYVAGCYFRGVGGGVDYVEAFRWYSSPSGDSDGSRRRRGCHVDYSAETSRGGAAAAAWRVRGDGSRRRRRLPRGLFRGDASRRRRGCRVDYSVETSRGGGGHSVETGARLRYTKACQNGDIKAQAALADMYDSGLGCERDADEARTYYRACNAGVSLARGGGG